MQRGFHAAAHTMVLIVVQFLINIGYAHSTRPWSYQQSLFVASANPTYGVTPPLLVGRGFMTLISGYDSATSEIFVHTTDDGYVKDGNPVWSQQAKLKSADTLLVPSAYFGRTMVSFGQTLLVAAAGREGRRGRVYVFNGSERHWSEVQIIGAPEVTEGDLFGDSLALHNDRLVIGARGRNTNAGVAYIYERPSGGLLWSRTARLFPRVQGAGFDFAQKVALYETTVAIAANNDNPEVGPNEDSVAAIASAVAANRNTGSAYIFTGSAGTWSQQAKLIAADFTTYQNGDSKKELDQTLGPRVMGPHVAVSGDSVVMGIINVNRSLPTREAAYVWTKYPTNSSYQLTQKLLAGQDSEPDAYTYSHVLMDTGNTLIVTAQGSNQSSAYIFKSSSNSWSLQQKLHAFDADAPLVNNSALDDAGTHASTLRRDMRTNFSNPALWGTNLIFHAGTHGGVQIRNQYDQKSCLQLWMSDHFLDGWDTAVLTVRAPDLTNDTFHPHCDQVDPFMVRYCPYQPSDEGVYIVKVFAATAARFYWELSWQVVIEATNETFRGDFATKMQFRYNSTTSSFALVQIQNPIVLGEESCFRCTRIASLSWAQLQIEGNSAFWPLIVTGAPYYISDYEGRNMTSAGKVCGTETASSMCYQTMSDGLYVLRLGGGLFGRLTGFPKSDASWEGCGQSGGLHDQMVFRIADSKCTMVQMFRYTSRCSLPPPISTANYTRIGVATTPSPTYGGTVKPTQNVFGLGTKGGANSQVHRQRGSRVRAAQVTAHELFDPEDKEYVEMLYGADQEGGVSWDAGYEVDGGSDEEEQQGEGEEVEQDPSGFDLVARLLRSNRPSSSASLTAPDPAPSSARSQEGQVQEAGFADEPPLSEEELERIFRVPNSPEALAAARKYFVH